MLSCVIEGTIDGLSPGEHGLAVHETGDVSRGCATLGDHFNPRYFFRAILYDNMLGSKGMRQWTIN